MGRSNYLSVGGGFGPVVAEDTLHAEYRDFCGIYFGNSKTRTSDVTSGDGTSNTAAFGEFLGGLRKDGARAAELSWMGSGMLVGKYGLKPIYGPDGNDYYFLQFQSVHAGGAVLHFAFADGSVRGVRQDISTATWLALTGMRDGRVLNIAELE